MTKFVTILFISLLLFVGPTMTVCAQTTEDTEIATAPINSTLSAMNQVPLRIGTSEARVAQVALMVNRDYPPGQPTFYVADRTLRLPTQFVANDPRRRSNVGLEWTFDTRRSQPKTILNGIPQLWTTAEVVDQTRIAINRWVSLPCYSAYFGELPYPIAPGFENIEWIDDFYLGAEPQRFRPVAEITVGGFLPASFFRQIYGVNGDNILGVTYQFVFYDRATGLPTDIDHDGKMDGSWSEIYFNDLYYWGDATAAGVDPFSVVDLQTIALHESGHAFGLGHFGQIFQNHGGLQIADYNIMNRVYPGPLRTITGTPTATFCGLYGNWH
jgi:hypothetical protein